MQWNAKFGGDSLEGRAWKIVSPSQEGQEKNTKHTLDWNQKNHTKHNEEANDEAQKHLARYTLTCWHF